MNTASDTQHFLWPCFGTPHDAQCHVVLTPACRNLKLGNVTASGQQCCGRSMHTTDYLTYDVQQSHR